MLLLIKPGCGQIITTVMLMSYKFQSQKCSFQWNYPSEKRNSEFSLKAEQLESVFSIPQFYTRQTLHKSYEAAKYFHLNHVKNLKFQAQAKFQRVLFAYDLNAVASIQQKFFRHSVYRYKVIGHDLVLGIMQANLCVQCFQ